jgi:DNA-binding MarR family transcriptional regulator
MQPEISQKDISYLLDMRNQSLSELLTKLEKAGLINRTQSETDRRVMNIKLTKEGEDAANQAEQGKQDYGQIFDCLGEEERKNLSEYLARIITELEKQMGGETDFPEAWGPRGMMPVLMQRLRESGGLTPEMLEELRKHGGFRSVD